MINQFNSKDFEIMLESLKYSKMKFEEHEKYPSIEFKNQRIKEIETTIDKVRALTDIVLSRQ